MLTFISGWPFTGCTTIQFHTQKSENLSEMKDLLFPAGLGFVPVKISSVLKPFIAIIGGRGGKESLWEIIGMNFQGCKRRPA